MPPRGLVYHPQRPGRNISASSAKSRQSWSISSGEMTGSEISFKKTHLTVARAGQKGPLWMQGNSHEAFSIGQGKVREIYTVFEGKNSIWLDVRLLVASHLRGDVGVSTCSFFSDFPYVNMILMLTWVEGGPSKITNARMSCFLGPREAPQPSNHRYASQVTVEGP